MLASNGTLCTRLICPNHARLPPFASTIMRLTTSALALLLFSQCWACNLSDSDIPNTQDASVDDTLDQKDASQDTQPDVKSPDTDADMLDMSADTSASLQRCAQLALEGIYVRQSDDESSPQPCAINDAEQGSVSCTRLSPCGTLEQAIASLDTTLRATSTMTIHIQSADTPYIAPDGLTLKDLQAALLIVGVDETWQPLSNDGNSIRPTIESTDTLLGTLRLDGETGHSIELRNLIIKGPDLSNVTPAEGSHGAIAYTLRASNFSETSPLVLLKTRIIGGIGGPGSTGADASPAQVPANLNASSSGAGQSCNSGFFGGRGGKGGDCILDTSAERGSGFPNVTGGKGATGNSCLLVSYSDCSDREGTPGSVGTSGLDGINAMPGTLSSSPGVFSNTNTRAITWTPPTHTPATAAQSGGPGAGGGGGSGASLEKGERGGAGGGGGCQGGDGQHGLSGGASIALMLNAVSIEVTQTQVDYGVGGDGGDGGDAGQGTQGGEGYITQIPSCRGPGESIRGPGGNGGDGGDGGDGAPGLGGCQGPVIGVLSDAVSLPTLPIIAPQNTMGTPGAHGSFVGGGIPAQQCEAFVADAVTLITP